MLTGATSQKSARSVVVKSVHASGILVRSAASLARTELLPLTSRFGSMRPTSEALVSSALV